MKSVYVVSLLVIIWVAFKLRTEWPVFTNTYNLLPTAAFVVRRVVSLHRFCNSNSRWPSRRSANFDNPAAENRAERNISGMLHSGSNSKTAAFRVEKKKSLHGRHVDFTHESAALKNIWVTEVLCNRFRPRFSVIWVRTYREILLKLKSSVKTYKRNIYWFDKERLV